LRVGSPLLRRPEIEHFELYTGIPYASCIDGAHCQYRGSNRKAKR